MMNTTQHSLAILRFIMNSWLGLSQTMVDPFLTVSSEAVIVRVEVRLSAPIAVRFISHLVAGSNRTAPTNVPDKPVTYVSAS